MLRKKITALVGSFALLLGLSALPLFSEMLVGEGEESSSSSDYLEEEETTNTLVNGDYRLDFSSSNLNFVLTNTLTGESLIPGGGSSMTASTARPGKG
jgi:hypothetical protein